MCLRAQKLELLCSEEGIVAEALEGIAVGGIAVWGIVGVPLQYRLD